MTEAETIKVMLGRLDYREKEAGDHILVYFPLQRDEVDIVRAALQFYTSLLLADTETL